ncbi:MAG: ATP-dependent helicase HrpB, partial [Enterobacteriaceae bacterium]
MSSYPVSELVQPLLSAFSTHAVVLLNAPTGAGKSTWLPLQLLASPLIKGKILLLEPRRLAARNIAWRLAQQLGEEAGETIGYRMRSETRTSARTRLEVITEGVLTRQLQADPLLEGVALVILDEFHERSLQSDLALALLYDVQQGLREDLRILVMSATLDDSRLSQYLPDAPLLISAGRSYPVQREYRSLSPQQPQSVAIADMVCQLLRQQSGSLLLFLPGIGEIRRIQELLEERVSQDVDLCPLYGALTLEQQQKAIQPASPGRRKVVLATNIAESSLTIEGVRLVVDSSLERETRFDLRSGLTRLVTQRISKAAMTQRAGRAGREEAGTCWHLLAKEQADRATEQSEAEILHSDLSPLLLELLQWGCNDSSTLLWLDPPPAAALSAARRLLHTLGALQDNGQLNAQGRQMAALGTDPRLAALLLEGIRQGPEALATAALLTAIIEEPPRSGDSDLIGWLQHPSSAWKRRAAQLVKRSGQRAGSIDTARAPLLLAGAFADRIARSRGAQGRFQLANGIGAWLDEEQSLSHH